jgi:hypothetical protein
MLELERRGLPTKTLVMYFNLQTRLSHEVDVEGSQNPPHLVGKGYSSTAGK